MPKQKLTDAEVASYDSNYKMKPPLRTSCDVDAVIDGLPFRVLREVVQRLMPEFERRHAGVRVRVQQIPWSAAHEKLLTAFVGGGNHSAVKPAAASAAALPAISFHKTPPAE